MVKVSTAHISSSVYSVGIFAFDPEDFIVFVLSILFSNIIGQIGFNETVSQTKLGASKTNAYYVDEERAEHLEEKRLEAAESQTFYKVFERYKVHLNVLTGLVIFIYLFLSKNGFGKLENTLFSYGLATASLANFFTQIFAVHNRAWQIAGVFILTLLVVFLSKNDLRNIRFSFLKVRLPLTIFFLAITPYFLYLISLNLAYTSPYIFLLPQAHWINPEEAGLSLRQFIGLFL